MGRRKSDTIEIKSDMKLKINGHVVDTRDILQFLETREIVRSESRKAPLIVRKYKFALGQLGRANRYAALVQEAINKVKCPKMEDCYMDGNIGNAMTADPDEKEILQFDPVEEMSILFEDVMAEYAKHLRERVHKLEEKYHSSVYYVSDEQLLLEEYRRRKAAEIAV